MDTDEPECEGTGCVCYYCDHDYATPEPVPHDPPPTEAPEGVDPVRYRKLIH